MDSNERDVDFLVFVIERRFRLSRRKRLSKRFRLSLRKRLFHLIRSFTLLLFWPITISSPFLILLIPIICYSTRSYSSTSSLVCFTLLAFCCCMRIYRKLIFFLDVLFFSGSSIRFLECIDCYIFMLSFLSSCSLSTHLNSVGSPGDNIISSSIFSLFFSMLLNMECLCVPFVIFSFASIAFN